MGSAHFYDQVFPVLSLMPVWALLVICWLLQKGELCPGQRSRIQGELITLWTVLGVGLMMGMEAVVSGGLLVLGALGVVYGVLLSIWQSKLPGKRSIPDKAIYGALAPLGLFAVGVLWTYGSLVPLLMMMASGTALAHLLIVKARHRLQAFNLLLPVFGVVVAIVSLLVIAVMAALNSAEAMNEVLINDMLWYIGFPGGGAVSVAGAAVLTARQQPYPVGGGHFPAVCLPGIGHRCFQPVVEPSVLSKSQAGVSAPACGQPLHLCWPDQLSVTGL